MTEKRELYVRLIHQGMTNSAACRQLGIDRKTGHWWKNGGVVIRNGVTRVVAPITAPAATPAESSTRYLSEEETGHHRGRRARWPDVDVDRRRARTGGVNRRERAEAQRWSPEQTAHAVKVDHGVVIATETIYQALYSPQRVLQRDPQTTLRTRRPNRRRRRRGDVRLGRFVVPLTMIDDRPDEADDRQVPGHWEGDLIVGAFNRSAIGTLVEPRRGSRSWSTSTASHGRTACAIS